MGTKEEINEMFDALESDATSDLTDPPEEPDEPQQPEPEPKTEPPATPQPTDDDGREAKTEPPATTPPEDELSKFKRENEELRKKLEDSITKKDEPPKTSPPATDAPISEENFLGDEDPEELAHDSNKFNKLLNTIYKKAVEFARSEIKRGKEETYRKIPTIVDTSISTKETLKKLSDEFYKDNEDLKPFGKVVSVVFGELVEKDPNKSYGEILKDVGTEVRTRLELPKDKTETKPKPDDEKPPPLPRKKGGKVQQPKPESNPLASEIDAMNKALNS